MRDFRCVVLCWLFIPIGSAFSAECGHSPVRLGTSIVQKQSQNKRRSETERWATAQSPWSPRFVCIWTGDGGLVMVDSADRGEQEHNGTRGSHSAALRTLLARGRVWYGGCLYTGGEAAACGAAFRPNVLELYHTLEKENNRMGVNCTVALWRQRVRSALRGDVQGHVLTTPAPSSAVRRTDLRYLRSTVLGLWLLRWLRLCSPLGSANSPDRGSLQRYVGSSMIQHPRPRRADSLLVCRFQCTSGVLSRYWADHALHCSAAA